MSALGGGFNRSTQHSLMGGRMECLTIRRGYFRGFTAAEQTGTLRSLASDTKPWDSNPSRKNEIECCVDRLNPPPIADIRHLFDHLVDACDQCWRHTETKRLSVEHVKTPVRAPKRVSEAGKTRVTDYTRAALAGG